MYKRQALVNANVVSPPMLIGAPVGSVPENPLVNWYDADTKAPTFAAVTGATTLPVATLTGGGSASPPPPPPQPNKVADNARQPAHFTNTALLDLLVFISNSLYQIELLSIPADFRTSLPIRIG